MLFVSLCVAGFLAGYRVGYPEGNASGLAKRQSEQPYPKVYEVGDLIRQTDDNARLVGDQPDYGILIGAVEASVFPEEWKSLGGLCSIAVVPSHESFAVNATSGVHDRLQTFLGDLASVKTAVKASRQEREASERARMEWTASILEPVAERVGKDLKLIDSDFDVIGSWSVQRTTSEGSATPVRYTFVDTDTVRVPSPTDASESTEQWYSMMPGSIVISGNADLAATATNDVLVLISQNDPTTFLTATRVEGEQ